MFSALRLLCSSRNIENCESLRISEVLTWRQIEGVRYQILWTTNKTNYVHVSKKEKHHIFIVREHIIYFFISRLVFWAKNSCPWQMDVSMEWEGKWVKGGMIRKEQGLVRMGRKRHIQLGVVSVSRDYNFCGIILIWAQRAQHYSDICHTIQRRCCEI
jgi:hypothetical protein